VPTTDLVLPPNYRTVLDVLEGVAPGVHLTAQDIWVRARERRPRIGFATVHRGLARLHELGAVMKLEIPGEASAVYEPAASPHAHFICSNCGTLSDLDFAVASETISGLAARYGVAIEHEAVTFTGRCARCAQAAP
jgi:Fe2+ or Zn2+ uptake regulation protein